MRNLIKKILKEEQDFDDFGFVPELSEVNPAKLLLYNLVSELKPEPTDRGNYILYKNKKGKILMAQESLTDLKTLIVDYHRVWKKLEKMGLSHAQIQDLCTEVFKKIFDRDTSLVLNSLQIEI